MKMIWVSLMLGIFNESKALHATCEVIYGSLEQDLAMSSYADDVSRISLGQCNWARYLGERVHYAGRTHEEVALRLQASKGAWTRMGSFWLRPGATGSKLLVYKALVQSTLLSGIEVLVLDKQKYQQVHRFILRTGRKLLQGRAGDKELQSDGRVLYTACSSKAVCKMLGLSSS